jgi:ComF family protein
MSEKIGGKIVKLSPVIDCVFITYLLFRIMLMITLPSSVSRIYYTLLGVCCLLCNRKINNSTNLCDNCFQALPWIHMPCLSCGQSLIVINSICGECLRESPAFTHCIAACAYDDAMRYLIRQLKFQHQLSAAKTLTRILLHILKMRYQHDILPELIIPIPLHIKRLRERGFNQAGEIAKYLAKYFRRPLSFCHFQRIRDTMAQSRLPAEDRHRNIKNAFQLYVPLKAKHVAIVDDVITTGNTVTEIARLLHSAGVSRIDVWVCAKA